MKRSALSKILLPYRFLPFSVKLRFRQAIERFSYHYQMWKTERPDRNSRRIRNQIAAFSYKPKISIAMPVYDTPFNFLDLAIRSVVAQFYEDWELCICDDASTDENVRATLRKWQAREPRIKVHYSTVNEHISGASNRALALATGEFVGLLDHDDVIAPNALFENVKLLQQHPDADLIYSDQDKLDEKGRRVRPFFKPDWTPELLLEVMYTAHFAVYRKKLLDEVGGFRLGFEGSQDYDLSLRVTERTNKVHHIPKILYHWRMAPGSAAGSTTAKPYAYIAAKKAIAEHLERRGTPGKVLDGQWPGLYRVVYDSPPKVSVIVPNYNHARFLKQRIESILNQTFQDFELILLDDCSTDDSRSILSSYATHPRVRTVEFNKANSGSTFKQWNKGVRLARGEYVWIAESDDYADPRFLDRLVPILDAKPEVMYVSSRSWIVSGDGEVNGYADSRLFQLDPQRWAADFEADGHAECRNYSFCTNTVPNASAVVFRATVFRQVGAADESMHVCGDFKLWASMALSGNVAYVAEPLNYFRSHGTNVRNMNDENALARAEYLQVVRWLGRSVSPTSIARKELRRTLPWLWTPAVTTWGIPLRRRSAMIADAVAIDPFGTLPKVIPLGLSALWRKFLKHWHEFAYAPAKSRSANRRARELWAWRTSKTPQFPTVAQLSKSIATLSGLDPSASAETDSDAPIFLLSTGMRTGSTLLQRILITDSRLLLWGEPMGEMNITSRLARIISDCVSPWLLDSWHDQRSPDSPELAKSWIAHLNPSADNFRLGLRSLFDTWLGCPARKNGFYRWGFKEVRLGATSAVLLHWLYPNAKFILLTRHPYDCYRSFADAGSNPHFVEHPNYVVNSAAGFAREWNRIAMSWSELPTDFPSRLIKYEDLTSGNFDFRGLESWLGLKLNESEALSEKVGRTAFRPRLHAYERWIVSREAAPGMRALGYTSRPVAPAKPSSLKQPECAVPDQKSA